MNILVTGTAGFIGFHLSKKLANKKDRIIGIDSLNSYYDVTLKLARLKELGIDEEIFPLKEIKSKNCDFRFINIQLENRIEIERIFEKYQIDVVINLAAQAGVRYSIENPYSYIDSNIVGFMNILECCRSFAIKHLVFASSSSVYGLNAQIPFSESDNVDHPISLYAATKKSNELMAHTYSYLYKIPCTGLRFFTVYGPWGRPDMALFKFTKAIFEDKPIDIYNYGDMHRDFTYIDDVVNVLERVSKSIPQTNQFWDSQNPDPSSSIAPYRIYNVGNHTPVNLLEFISLIEKYSRKMAIKNFLPIQDGDVYKTYADTHKIEEGIGLKPNTPIEVGVKAFIDWYRSYYHL